MFINSFAGYETNENIIGLQLGAVSSGSVRSIAEQLLGERLLREPRTEVVMYVFVRFANRRTPARAA